MTLRSLRSILVTFSVVPPLSENPGSAPAFAENTGGDDQGNLQDDLQHFLDLASNNGLNLNAKTEMPSSKLRSNLAMPLHIEQT